MPINSFIYPAKNVPVAYEVANSCRFNDDDSANLTKTFSSAGNRKTFTYSCWLKRGNLDNSSTYNMRFFGSTDALHFWVNPNTVGKLNMNIAGGELTTNRLFRDVSAWYHIVLAVDTTQATSSNRLKLYINGVQETSFSTETYPSEDADSSINNNVEHSLGRQLGQTRYYDGYMAECVFIDGSALAPTSFGEFDEDSPTIWKPKDVSGLTFGTNGFYLDFEDSADLGADVSGNSNDFTVTNLAATDQATDTPTNNFATLNPLNFGHGSLSEGNLKWTASAQVGNLAFGTIGIDMDVSNQFYWETKIEGGEIVIGIAPTTLRWNDTGRAGSYGYYSDGNKYSGTSASSYGASFTTNDIIGVLVGNGTLTFYKNGASQGTAFSSLSGTYLPFLAEVGSTNSMNFGSPPYSISSGNTDPEGYGNFEYSTNSGYALNTKNLAEYG